MIKSLIVAKTDNHVIGQGNQLLWHFPKDLQHFKRITMGHHVIMGRKTFAAINKPLPGRKLIIVTRNPNYQVSGCTVVHSITAALAVAEQMGETEVLIAGGGEIYQATLGLADKIYLTEIKAKLEGDAFFPTIHANEWKEVKRTHHPADEKHRYAYNFVELIRRKYLLGSSPQATNS
ncbi:MAG: dihydrofolate reductase [Amoebophilaceae bacterium]|jgi:dihydrofolate reductase|nr:dihydrofolate reductase [Amoebophilaceae bacterium]